MTPEQIAAAIRDPNSGLMPVQVGVFCDGCGTTEEHDYLVREDSTQADRFEVARSHLRDKAGWQCDARGDYCPKCKANEPVDQAAAVYPAPGSEIPGVPGYVVGTCEHRVAKSEWRAGFRTCERCNFGGQDGGDV